MAPSSRKLACAVAQDRGFVPQSLASNPAGAGGARMTRPAGDPRDEKLAAKAEYVEDPQGLDTLEMDDDVNAYQKAKAEDDGERISLSTLREEFTE